MKYICHRYYTTFTTQEIEAETPEKAALKASDEENLSSEEIMDNLERAEDLDATHPAEERGLCDIHN